MTTGEFEIRLTKHAQRKLRQRGIQLRQVLETLENPIEKREDPIDSDLVHCIGPYKGRYLRVIGKWEGETTFIVVTAFIDRRIRMEE